MKQGLTELEKFNLSAIKDRAQAEEWRLVTKAVKKSLDAPQAPQEARQLAWVALWLVAVVVILVVCR